MVGHAHYLATLMYPLESLHIPRVLVSPSRKTLLCDCIFQCIISQSLHTYAGLGQEAHVLFFYILFIHFYRSCSIFLL